MAKQEYIYRVEFTEPPIPEEDKTDFYFHSLGAIYDKFTPEQVGCKITRLWNAHVSDGVEYTNRKGTVRITRHPIVRHHKQGLLGD